MSVVATAGHVDHGKSTLVRHLTGTDPDRLAEEKARGLTIDLGFAVAVLPSGRSVSFVDVPGHARFVKNMLAGVGAVDACLFVVDATEGWRAQSEEHLRILDVLGLRHGMVALTKVGRPSARAPAALRAEVAERVAGTFLEHADVVAVDVVAGIGTGGDGPLVSALERVTAAAGAPADHGRPRLWVDRSFPVRGAGTVVTGTLEGGVLGVGDRVVVEPGGTEVRVKGLQNHQRPLVRAEPGNRVAVNLAGLSHREVRRGDALVAPGAFHRSSVVDATLHVLPSLERPVGRRGAYLGYVGAGEHAVRLRVLGGAASLTPGSAGAVRIWFPVALPLRRGDRFVLRDAGRAQTVGGGEVLDVDPSLPAGLAAPDGSVARTLRERGWIDVDELERLTGEHVPPTVGRWVVDPGLARRERAELLAEVVRGGTTGVDLTRFGERRRLLLRAMPEVVVEGARAFAAELATVQARRAFLDGHPFVRQLREHPFDPPTSTGVDRAVLALVAGTGTGVEIDRELWLSAAALDRAAAVVAELVATTPGGVTVSAVARALGTTRRYALPILGHLDRRGVTRRVGTVRVGGPALTSGARTRGE